MPASEESAFTQSGPASEFYTWTFPGAPVRIHLQLNVVERLSHEVRRAFESIPSHSVEIGGVLLGTADFVSSPVIEIKDFEPFLCEYRPDHQFILSDSDRRKLEKLVAAGRSERDDGLTVVGYYRSHIGDGLSLSQEDVSLAQKYFYDPANVFLVIKPVADGSASAGFFFWDQGRIDSEFTFLEFPFEARQLTGARVKPSPMNYATPAAQDAETSDENPSFDVAELSRTTEPERPEARAARGPRWMWYPLFATLMIALGAVSYQAYLKWAPAQPAVPVISDAPALALQVERHGSDLRVRWNRYSKAVRQATAAVLAIRDGDLQQQELRLEHEQLLNGSVLYTPANTTVQFRLEITAPDSTKMSETVLALTAAKSDLSRGLAPDADPTVDKQPGAPPSQSPGGSATASTASESDSTEPVRVVMVDAPAQPNAAPTLSLPARPESAANEDYTPPRPTREVQPRLPPNAANDVTSLVEVDIRVHINESGRVIRAESLPKNEPVSGFLVGAARNAALLWRFEPARRGSQRAASEVVLRFQYRPAARE